LLQADAILKISAPGRERDSRFWDTRGGEMPVVHPGRHAHMTPAAASRLLIGGGSPLAPLADHCPDAGTARRYPLAVEMCAGWLTRAAEAGARCWICSRSFSSAKRRMVPSGRVQRGLCCSAGIEAC